MKTSAEFLVRELSHQAGIQINGSNAWDLQVFDNRFYQMIMQNASLALGETFMARWWDAEKPDQFFERVFQCNLEEKIKSSWSARWLSVKSAILNRQSSGRAFIVGKKHYDIDNDLYELMLDPSMTYSCGYWNGVKTLEQAQYNKLDLICRKLRLTIV